MTGFVRAMPPSLAIPRLLPIILELVSIEIASRGHTWLVCSPDGVILVFLRDSACCGIIRGFMTDYADRP